MSRVAVVLMLGLAVACGAEELRGARPIDTHRPEDQTARIEWKQEWRETHKANAERWRKEIERDTRDGGMRALRLRVRMIHLCEELLGRYPDDVDGRIHWRHEIADHLYTLGFRGRNNYALKQLIDELPGRPDVALSACMRVLERTPWDQPWATEEGTAWVEYAARRLLALHRAGHVPASEPWVDRSRRAMMIVRRSQGRLLEAAEWLAQVHGANGDSWPRLMEAELYHQAGHGEGALQRFRDLQRESNDHHARERITHLEPTVLEARPIFPGEFGLQVRWEMLEGVAVAEAATRLAALLAADAEGDCLVEWGAERRTSLWAAVDRHLAREEEAARKLLRTLGEDDARRRLRAARRADAASALLPVFREHPWTAPAAEALLSHGEDALRKGHPGLAQRSFGDLLARAADDATAQRAQVGLWLALAGRRDALAAAFEGIGPEATYPWMGTPTPAKTIRERLLAGVQAAVPQTAPALRGLAQRAVRAPHASPWPWEVFGRDMPRELLEAVAARTADLQARDGDAVVSGPNVLSVYGSDLSRPRWTRTSALLQGLQGKAWRRPVRLAVLPGACRPAVADGRIITRWGLDPIRRVLRAVAAFDQATGEMLWSTDGQAGWDDAWPVSDPTVADGRVYVLTVPSDRGRVLPVLPIRLACLDGTDGRLLWQQKLASHTFTLVGGRETNYRELHFDFVHHGNAVTVADGAVYCSTGLGFVARCDARDGLIEWARAYPRLRVGHNAARLVRRLGAAPLVAGDTVVCVPRDYPGVFAVDRATGALRWESAFAPSHQAVGLSGSAVVVCDDREVAALDVATGRPLWHRHIDDGLLGRPVLGGGSLYVATPSRLLRLDAATGRLHGSADWGRAGPLHACALRGSDLVGLTERWAAAPERRAGALNPKAPTQRPPMRLPMTRSWAIQRPNPRLLVPPPEAKLAGKVLVLSEGALECLAATPRGAVDWRRLLAPGYRRIEWAEKALLLIYPRRMVCIDAVSGVLRWETAVDFPIRQWLVAGPYVVAREYDGNHRSRRTACIELASGKTLWTRSFRGLGRGNGYDDHLPAVAWDGQHLHFLGHLTLDEKRHVAVLVRPADGRIVGIRPFLAKNAHWPKRLVLEGRNGFFLDANRAVHQFTLGGGDPRRCGADLRELNTDYLRRFELVGDWLQVHSDYNHKRPAWILRRGDPGYVLRREGVGTVRGNRLYAPSGHSLAAIDLPSKREQAVYRIPPTRRYINSILELAEEGNTLLVVSALYAGPAYRKRPARLRVDTFERNTGKHLAGQVVPDVPFWEYTETRDWREQVAHRTQALWQDGVLLLTDFHGVHAFIADGAADPPLERPVRVVHRRAEPVTVDGRLAEWDEADGLPLKRPGRPDGRLSISHDAERLYLSVACPDGDARPRRGRGDAGGGDWLEVGLMADSRSVRLGLGRDRMGRAVWESMGPRELPDGLVGRVGGDPAAGRVVYELAIPLRSVVGDDDVSHLRHLGLSVTVWDEDPRLGPTRAYAWGDALAGRLLVPLRHQPLFLHPLSRRAYDAGSAIARELPELPAAWAFLHGACRIHRGQPALLKALHRDILQRHRSGPIAVKLLVHLDQWLRTRLDADPTQDVLRLAAAAGVDDAARRRYQQLTQAYLSQWVHLDAKTLPDGFLLHFDTDPKGRGDSRRVFWGAGDVFDDGELGTPTLRHAGGLPPAGSWHELRVPLVWLGLHDTPVTGLGYYQRGGYRLVFDRLALVRPGREVVVIDDELPKGKTYGSWHWVSNPRRSGSRAHTEPNHLRNRSSSRRLINSIEPPIIDHIQPDPAAPYLSQWVYIDPKAKPKYLAMALHDGADWGLEVSWGGVHRYSRYLGPLPQAGSWQELRVPLTGSPIGHRPIRGFSFGHYSGRVYWDRTAIVANGRERVLIDDDAPAAGSVSSTWSWAEQPARSGKRAHTAKRPSGSYSYHNLEGLEQPVVDHMPFRPDRAVAVLRRHIPQIDSPKISWRLVEDLLHYSPADHKSRIETYTWFLRQRPDHPQGVAMLIRLLQHHRAMETPDPLTAVEAVIADCKIPLKAAYTYRRQHAHPADCFVRTWQLLGPFPNPDRKGLDVAYPPETKPTDLAAAYDGTNGKIRWKAHTAKDGRVSFIKEQGEITDAVGYAVCWVESPRRHSAILEVGSDDGCKIWINRRQVFALQEDRTAVARQNVVPIVLNRGVNEVLVKVEQGKGDWEFYFELVGADGRSLLDRVTLTTMPPR